jgi:Rieske Fe-S protein
MILLSKKYFSTLLILSGILASGLSSCQKGKTGPVPNVLVDIRMYASDPTFVPLNAVGGWTYASGGNRGILIYRKTQSDFMAFDRTCTYLPADVSETVSVDANNSLIATDAHCGSKFQITDGTVNKGPATLPLKAYQTSFDGNLLHIYN